MSHLSWHPKHATHAVRQAELDRYLLTHRPLPCIVLDALRENFQIAPQCKQVLHKPLV